MARKTPVLLRRGPMSGRINALTNYRSLANGVIRVAGDGKHDVSSDFDHLMLEELYGKEDDSPDIIRILDGVAQDDRLTNDEIAQVRAFHDRLKAIVERHNARLKEDHG